MEAAAAGSINLMNVDHNHNRTVDTWGNASDAWVAYNRRGSVVVIESAAADQQPINVVYVMDELNRCLRRRIKTKKRVKGKITICKLLNFNLFTNSTMNSALTFSRRCTLWW